MTSTITVTWNGGEGKITLNLDAFFPCAASEIIHFDDSCLKRKDWCNDRQQILSDLRNYLDGRIKKTQDKKLISQLTRNLKTIERLLKAK